MGDIYVHPKAPASTWSFDDLPSGDSTTPAPAPAAAGASAWSFDDLPKPPGGLAALPNLGEKAAKTTQKSMDQLVKIASDISAGKDPDTDYDNSAPFDIALALARSDNPKEASAALERRVGAGNYGKDAKGNWWVRLDGKKVAVRPPGFLKGLAVDLAATSPQTAGAMIGGAEGAGMGASAGPWGAVIGGTVGAGAGALTGYGASELEKSLEGTRDKTGTEAAIEETKQIGENAALEGGAKFLSTGGAKFLAPPVRNYLGITPETERRTEWLLRQGARPPVSSAAPGAKLLQYDQAIRNAVMGDPKAKMNKEVVKRMTYDVMSELMGPEEAKSALQEVYDISARLSTKEVGTAVSDVAKQTHEGLSQDVANSVDYARKAMEPALDEVHRYINGQTGRLGEDVSQALVDARVEMGNRFQNVYNSIDRAAGNERVVPIDGFRLAARAIIADLPEGQVRGIIKDIADADPNIKLTFAQAHALRNTLYQMGRAGMNTLTPTFRTMNAVRSGDKITEAMEEAADFSNLMDFSGIAKNYGLSQDVVDSLAEADKAYGKEIAIFKNAAVNKLVRDAKDGIFADPTTIAKQILAPGYVEQTKAIMQMLPPEIQDQVVRADAFNLVKSATDPDGTINAVALRKELADPSRKATMDAAYNPQMLSTIRSLVDQLAALNGKINISDIKQFTGPEVQGALTKAIEAQKNLDNFAKQDILRALASQDPKLVDPAINSLLSGGKALQLNDVRNALGGENSPQWKMIQKYALKNVLRSSIDKAASGEKMIKGGAISDSMSKFDIHEQNMLFPDNLRESLLELGNDVEFLFPRDIPDAGGSIKAAEIKSGVPWKKRQILNWIKSKVEGYITDHPKVLGFFAGTHVSDPALSTQLMAEFSRWLVNSELQSMKER